MRLGRAWAALVIVGMMPVVALAGAEADSRATSVSEVAPGIYSVKNLPIARGGRESGVAAEKVVQFRAARVRAWSDQEIEASASDHADFGAARAKSLFLDVFGSQVGDLLQDPAAALHSAEEILAFRDNFTAVIDPAGPEDRALVVSTAPIKTDDGEIPDLGLEPHGRLIRVKESTTQVEFSKELKEGIEIPRAELGLSFDEVRANAPDGSIVSVDESGGGDVAFYPNALTDTDLIAAPLANGVETFAHIRSEDSPEEIRMPVDAPAGGFVSSTGDNGAVVTDEDGEPVARVYPPMAIDAKGTSVPVTMTIDGADLVLSVPHRGSGYAYPILADPVIETWNWWTGTHSTYPGWSFVQDGDTDYQGSKYCFQVTINSCGAPSSGGGLFVYAPPGKVFNQWSGANWNYMVPGNDSYIGGATITSWRYKKGGASNGNPYAFWGIASANTWTDYQITDLDSGGNNRTIQGGLGAKFLALGLVTNSTMALPTGSANWRYNRLGAVQLQLYDQNPPNLNPISLAGLNTPASGWINQDHINDFRSIRASAWDSGLGIKRIMVRGTAAGGVPYADEWNAGCTGGFQSPCGATTPQGGVDVPVTPSALADGINTLTAVAVDAREEVSSGQAFTLLIDRQPPSIELSDQLAEATDSEDGQTQADEEVESISRTNYKLSISTNDHKPGAAVSGIRSIDISMNKTPGDLSTIEPVHHKDVTCSLPNCPATFNYDWELDLESLAVGDYVVQVDVEDLAGNPRTRTISFTYNPGTGLKEEYSFQHIDLPDGSSLDVNVANGNLVYTKMDTEQYSGDVPIIVERSYNSQLPLGESSAWGDRWTTNISSRAEINEIEDFEAAVFRDGSGMYGSDVTLPAENDAEFSSDMQSTIGRVGDDLEVTEVDSEITQVFNRESGLLEQLSGINSSTVSYDYNGQDELETIYSHNSFDPELDVALPVQSDDGNISEIGGPDPVEYEHDGNDRLLEVETPRGQTSYEYASASLLTEIELDDGTTVAIVYDAERRVRSIALSEPNKPTKNWTLDYQTPILVNTTTTVTDPSSQITRYFIGRSGKVISSRIGAESMAFSLSGTLYASGGKTLSAPGDYTLVTNASGGNLEQITILVEDAVVDQWFCAATCASKEHAWTVNRDVLASGVNAVKVFARRTNGEEKSERFEINVPTVPETPEPWLPPTEPEAIEFREANGLNTNPIYVHQIHNNPDYWYNEWGVPMDVSEISELRARELAASEAEIVLATYAIQNPSLFAGWYVEDVTGDIRVGFTSDVANQLAAVQSQFTDGLRVKAFDHLPTNSMAQLSNVESQMLSDIDVGDAPVWLEDVEIDVEMNRVVGIASDYTPLKEHELLAEYGNAVLLDEYEIDFSSGFQNVYQFPLAAGSGSIYYNYNLEHCTLGFGAKRKSFSSAGRPFYRWFAMTAAHCAGLVGPDVAGIDVFIATKQIGRFALRHEIEPSDHYSPDIAMVELDNARSVPCSVRAGATGQVRRTVQGVRNPSTVSRGMPIRKSGMVTGVQPGNVLRFYARDGYQMAKSTNYNIPGDSGGPLYSKYAGSW